MARATTTIGCSSKVRTLQQRRPRYLFQGNFRRPEGRKRESLLAGAAITSAMGKHWHSVVLSRRLSLEILCEVGAGIALEFEHANECTIFVSEMARWTDRC